ncbi:STAS domain-containing protein [Streptomyces sp. NPDC096080]|uniref:STAS domain-containing protein n=1 Tax=Streptomyces sp. NPDC096080 TaxID=3156693 RepID=UPI003326DF57
MARHLTRYHAPTRYAAADSLTAPPMTVIWDMRKVTFMDSVGLHLLEDQHRTLSARDATLALARAQGQPLRLLHLAAQLRPAGIWLALLATLPLAPAP